jgi:hypothetical protein
MKEIVKTEFIKNKIYTIRGKQVILDSDLAILYGVETRILNQAVRRNIERFPKDFMFQLKEDEIESLRSQFVTSKTLRGGRRYLPYVFTEQGVAMLSAVLRSEMAIKVSVQIMKAFVEMKKFISTNIDLFYRIETLEKKQIGFQIETEKKFNEIFKALESNKPKQGIFFDGQIFDSYKFITDLIKLAKKEIILIDNYIDESVLTLFSKIQNVKITIYTKNITKQLELEKFNSQYEKIEIKEFKKSHDRFLIIDKNEIYHIGASLKDLGKKWFAFSKLEKEILEYILKKINF